MPVVTTRALAALDTQDSWDRIADDDIVAADRRLEQFDLALKRLATQPMMGRARPELAPGLRSLPFRRHVVFYLPIDDGIDVVRVLHSVRDIDAAFADEP